MTRLWEMCPRGFKTYYEPFFGGGALFFYLYRKRAVQDAVLSDMNRDLILFYETVRTSIDELIRELRRGQYRYEKGAYESIRESFNRCKRRKCNRIRQMARFLYLNKTCYNGLYRVNRNGVFNVPFGRYKEPTILDEENLRDVSKAFKTARIKCADFETATSSAEQGDFVYLDPPYVPLNSTSVFTQYTEEGFAMDQQKRLAKVFKHLSDVGCFVLQSNAATDEIRELYAEFRQEEVIVSRPISSKKSTRSGIREVLISNFEPGSNQMQLGSI